MMLRAASLARVPLQNQNSRGESLTVNAAFVADRTMARINADYVGHEGTTDVITFNYLEGGESLTDGDVALDLFIGVDVAEREGRNRKNSNYARELTLYLVHGLLHAAGEDDLDRIARLRMRRREREVMKKLEKEFALDAIFVQ
ncbi:MAG: rRNA maturation RNase YbeY [Victivallales bacterium]|nr:rRNA maturation RNase YbeY [Victivallales bacterium]